MRYAMVSFTEQSAFEIPKAAFFTDTYPSSTSIKEKWLCDLTDYGK